MDITLEARVTIVTGAASGVGAAIARAAAAAGAHLLLADRDAGGLARVAADCGPDVAVIVADLETIDAPFAIAAAARARFGRIDALVNNAASVARATMIDTTPAFFDRLFAINTRAPFFLMQETVNDLRARRVPGAIVNILSVNAACGLPDLAVYSATKGALATLTRNTAQAHMADRIRVNGINLGWTLTEGEDRLQRGLVGEDWLERITPTLPLGRLVAPEDCARLALWLLSDASAPQTGTVTDLEQRVLSAP
jgi:NAD(P)-dependent dehydrogenase (short-subunit alcohol dehydrogenase family)